MKEQSWEVSGVSGKGVLSETVPGADHVNPSSIYLFLACNWGLRIETEGIVAH